MCPAALVSERNRRRPSVVSSEVADGRARNSGSLTGDVRDDDAAAAVAAAAAESVFVAWLMTSSPMAS